MRPTVASLIWHREEFSLTIRGPTIDAANEEGRLRAEISTLRRRALIKYRDLLEELDDNGADVAVHVAKGGELTSTRVPLQAIRRALGIIRESEESIHVIEIEGVLVGVNVRTRIFELFDDGEDKKYSGRVVGEARGQVVGLVVGERYRATILEEEEIVPVTGDTRSKYRLLSITGSDQGPAQATGR